MASFFGRDFQASAGIIWVYSVVKSLDIRFVFVRDLSNLVGSWVSHNVDLVKVH